ncbi:hypothetical protein BGZ51_009776 [Haplosporangium sp. Z 767]|nr:hypothetical protein BGZ51_009776 [Haplosporangium sp. Z 767]
MSSYTFVYPNGAITNPNYSEKSTYVSPKLFSLVAAFGPMTWYAAVQDNKSTATGSNWTSVRFNASNPSTRESDNILFVYPQGDPLLSIGTFEATTNTPAQGNYIIFYKEGGGQIFTAEGDLAPIGTTEGFLTLSNPQPIDMNGITLTNHSIAVTNSSDAYILDEVSYDQELYSDVTIFFMSRETNNHMCMSSGI